MKKTGICPVTEDALSKTALASAHKRYSIIAPVVAVVTDKKWRSEMIAFVEKNNKISKQTIRKYLCLYLAYQSINVLVPVESNDEKPLSLTQKNMRWALNKFFTLVDKTTCGQHICSY